MVDHSSFKFTPRIQKLNEIEVRIWILNCYFDIFNLLTTEFVPMQATSRVRVMFVLNLSKFWQLQVSFSMMMMMP